MKKLLKLVAVVGILVSANAIDPRAAVAVDCPGEFCDVVCRWVGTDYRCNCDCFIIK